MKPLKWRPAFLPKDDEAQLRKAGYVNDPVAGWTNTRDPWWVAVWIYAFWAVLCLVMGAGLYWVFSLPS